MPHRESLHKGLHIIDKLPRVAVRSLKKVAHRLHRCDIAADHDAINRPQVPLLPLYSVNRNERC